MPSHRRIAVAKDQSKALTSAIAMDVGKEMVAYLEVMYPDVFERMNSGCRLSIRNHIHNDIIAAMEIVGTSNHLERLKERVAFRRHVSQSSAQSPEETRTETGDPMRLWNFIRWYPWRSEAELIRWREGDWLPWCRADWRKNWVGQWVLK